jgi:hypothetical protein
MSNATTQAKQFILFAEPCSIQHAASSRQPKERKDISVLQLSNFLTQARTFLDKAFLAFFFPTEKVMSILKEATGAMRRAAVANFMVDMLISVQALEEVAMASKRNKGGGRRPRGTNVDRSSWSW